MSSVTVTLILSRPGAARPDDARQNGGMELREVMTTTPATREFSDEPLPDSILYAILDQARFAPNGGNRQAWHVIVVRDAARKQRIAELWELAQREDHAFYAAGLVPFVASEAYWRNPPGGPVAAARSTWTRPAGRRWSGRWRHVAGDHRVRRRPV